MKEQLERDIEVLRKIERLLNEELSEDTFYEYDFMEEWEEFKRVKGVLEFRLKSLATKEQEVSIWDVIEECKVKEQLEITVYDTASLSALIKFVEDKVGEAQVIKDSKELLKKLKEYAK